MTAPPRSVEEAFRPEIQGLRTVAALLVAAYHIWFRRVSGGVDVFFVVSGFLIIGSLVRQIERSGRVDFGSYSARLLGRLLPAALTVIAVTSLAVYLLLPRVLWADAIREALASAVYLENWQLALNAVDYLAREETPSPFMHFWALSTQGQFYVLWPILLVAAARLAHASGRPARAGLQTALVVVGGVSLAFSIVATRLNQPFTYFNTFARLWEFALGGMVSLFFAGRPLSTMVRTLLGWTGLLAVVSCGALLPVSRLFPGYAALWPTLAAALVLVAGTSGSRFGADRLLAATPLVVVGDISYAFYLWHWPLLVFYLAYSQHPEVSLLAGLGIIAVAGVLAWLTTTFIESPVRKAAAGLSPARTLAVAAVCGGVLVGSLAGWQEYTARIRRAAQRAGARHDGAAYPGARVLMEPTLGAALAPRAPIPEPFAVKGDLPVSYRDGCHQDDKSEVAKVCQYGRADARHTIALVGGSHSAQWLPALQDLAERHGVRILNLTKSACWFSDDPRTDKTPGPAVASCLRWNRKVIEVLRNARPDAVFTILTRAVRDVDSTAGERNLIEYVPEGYVAKFRELSAMGIAIVAVRDNPWSRLDPAQCIDMFGASSPRCRMRRDDVLGRTNPADGRDDLPAGMTTIDLSRYFCDSIECRPVVGNVLVYRDKHHITATYMRTLSAALAPHLAPWLDSPPLSPTVVAAGSASDDR
ncbi:acyltransferase [Luteitalea sp. TBR-22]|uniref:acyltransferase family protein n=1 Tax=Luteitalea sp. TBR-22 TaxID=2802971 RepID=UPI001AF79FED|nr:acyltransferase family protein [Luteitalea sp. TBR-22]BCS33161.1 acyltransferase [Luteitalea sp. TBR-22]